MRKGVYLYEMGVLNLWANWCGLESGRIRPLAKFSRLLWHWKPAPESMQQWFPLSDTTVNQALRPAALS
jgi:hypothetical protein